MKTTMKNGAPTGGFGIAAALFVAVTLVLAGCTNPLVSSSAAGGGDTRRPFGAAAPSAPGQSALGEIEPYTAAVYLGEDGEEFPTEEELSASARSVAGPTKDRINGDNIRNYVQVITVDKANGTVAGLFEARRISASQPLPGLKVRGLVRDHSYGILLLQGHWERDYAAETAGGDYAYTANPPTLLSVGYQEVTYTASASIKITVWPIYVDTRFTSGGLSAEPVVSAGKPGAVSLQASPWTVNWKVLRGASGTASGFGDLITAQRAAGSFGESLIVTGRKAVVRADGYEAAPVPAFNANTVTLPLTNYAGLSRIGKTGAVNFALSFIPFNATEGWAAHDAASVFDLAGGPPEWVIRNGLNGLTQDDKTDFTNFGNKPVTEANGNGALRFAVAEPSSAASGELLVSKGSLAASSLTFTTAGYTGTAQAWYAAVPSGAAEPGYAAYTPLGDIAPGTHTNEVTLPGTNGYDVYVVLLKDGKAGAPHKVVFSGSVLRQESGTGDDEPDLDPNPGEGDPGGEEPLDPTPGKGDPDEFPFTSIEAVRKYIDNLIGSGDFRGNSVNNPILLPLAVNLDENNTEKILTLIAGKGNTLTWTCPSVPLPKTSLASYLFLTMTGWSP